MNTALSEAIDRFAVESPYSRDELERAVITLTDSTRRIGDRALTDEEAVTVLPHVVEMASNYGGIPNLAARELRIFITTQAV